MKTETLSDKMIRLHTKQVKVSVSRVEKIENALLALLKREHKSRGFKPSPFITLNLERDYRSAYDSNPFTVVGLEGQVKEKRVYLVTNKSCKSLYDTHFRDLCRIAKQVGL